jgi:branched-chain amino acid transport system permease protein
MLRVKGVNLTKILPIALILVILAFAPYFLSASPYYLTIVRNVLMWMALSISWHFFSGYTKYISLGSAAFFGIGLYFTAKYLELSIHYDYYPVLPLPLIVLLAGLVTFALALVIGLVTLRLKGIYFAILTFSVSIVISNVINWWEITITGTRGTYFPLFDTQTAYYAIFTCTIVTLLLTTLLRRSKFGLALKMIGECEEAASHVGVNASIYKTLGFAISAMLMGLMGGCFATRLNGYVNTDMAFESLYSFLPAVNTLLGGIGTVFGPIIGSITVSLLSEYLRVILPHYFLIILGLILIAIVMFMPDGIMGIVEKMKTTKLFGSKRAKAPEKPP